MTAEPAALSVAPVRAVPRVEVRADHHDFVGLVGAGNFGDDVEAVRIAVVEHVVDLHLQRDRNLLLERPGHAAVVLDGEDHLRRDRRIVRVA